MIGQESANGDLSKSHSSVEELKEAMVYQKLWLTIVKEEEEKVSEPKGLGRITCVSEFSSHYHKIHLGIAKELGDKIGEGTASRNLGNAFYWNREFEKAIEYYEIQLKITKERGDSRGEGQAYEILGFGYHNSGNFKKAIQCHEHQLRISKENGDRVSEGRAICALGKAYHSMGDFKAAIHYHESCLQIANEARDTDLERRAYGCLGEDYGAVGNLKKAIDCLERYLRLCSEARDLEGKGWAYGDLGNVHGSIGNLKKAIDLNEDCLKNAVILKERVKIAYAYNNLGNAFSEVGNFKKAKSYNEWALNIYKQEGDQVGEGMACHSLGDLHLSLGDIRKAMHYHEHHLKIAKQLGNIAGEKHAYCGLGNAYHTLGDFKTAIEYYQRSLKIAREEGDRIGMENALGNLGRAYLDLGAAKKAMGFHECQLKIAQLVGDRIGEAKAHCLLGCGFELLGSLERSCDCYQSSVKILNEVRADLQCKDEWKISLRHRFQTIYTKLWVVLLKLGKMTEALLSAEQGRSQALKDLIEFNYGLTQTSFEFCSVIDIIPDTFSRLPLVFIAVQRNEITFWIVKNGKDVKLRTKKFSYDMSLSDVAEYLQSLMQTVREAIGVRSEVKCEDRSLEKLGETNASNEVRCDPPPPLSLDQQKTSLKTAYDVAVGPIADLVDGDEVIIVPEGPLWLAPYAAFVDSNSKFLSESFRIRMIPSMTTLRLIADCPTDCHHKSGALIVGDPWVQDIVTKNGRKLQQLPYAKEEVEMIGRILNTAPLTGRDATKDEVLKRLSSVALIHIAAHGRMEKGEIALAPSTPIETQVPKEADYLLKMSDVLNTRLRARLVVLSCCHSGRGEIKAEGVVGIARAFLGAGARSVLVSLWAIDDEATMEFMKIFYTHLMEGRSASEALNRAMKSMRESDEFREVKYWAPFVLIGDDVTLEFGG